MHPTLQEPVWGSDNFCKPAPQEIRNFNHQSADFNQKSKEYKPKKRRFPNQPDLSRYGAQHSNKSEHQLSKTKMSSQQSKDAACAENQGGFTACEFSSFCSEQPQWFEQLQLKPVSFCHGETSTTTYALIDHGSQFSFIVNEIADKLQISSMEHTSMSLRYFDIDHEMPVAKVDNAVHVSPHDKPDVKFSMNNLCQTPCLNIPAADVFNLNEICSSTDTFRHIHFPHLDHGKIGALLGVNSFLFSYPPHLIEGNNFIPSAIQTKLGWTLAGEYQLNNNRQQRHSSKTKHRPFVFHVSRNKTTEQPLDYLVHQFCKIEENGITTQQKIQQRRQACSPNLG